MPPQVKPFSDGRILHSGVSNCVHVHPVNNLANTISQNQFREFHLIFVTGVFGFINLLIRIWGKGQGHSRQ